MRFFCLLPFLFVLLPLDANGDTRSVICLGRGNSTSINSDYEANIHSLAAMLRSETASATPGLYTEYVVGDLPDGVYAVSRCRNGTDSSSCRACVTLALQEARTACPYHRESAFFNGNCSLRLLPGVHFDDLVLVSSETESELFSSYPFFPYAVHNILDGITFNSLLVPTYICASVLRVDYCFLMHARVRWIIVFLLFQVEKTF